MATTISIITPWLNHSELCRMYGMAVSRADQIIIVDNGSEADHILPIRMMIAQRNNQNDVYIRNSKNLLFAKANNQGLKFANGDIVVFLNNDIEAPSNWLDQVRRDVQNGALYGPSKMARNLGGQMVDYIEGWCIAGRREVWEKLGGWDAEHYKGLYWEDNDLCYRALKAGFRLYQRRWDIAHFNNYTSKDTPGAYDHAGANQMELVRRIENGEI